jgi:hypothetical protein
MAHAQPGYPAMEILIQDSDTKLYFKEHSEWVKDATDARVFRGPLDALRFCVEHQLRKVQLGFRYRDSATNDVHSTGLRFPNPAPIERQNPSST